jgi:hypothetical protein
MSETYSDSKMKIMDLKIIDIKNCNFLALMSTRVCVQSNKQQMEKKNPEHRILSALEIVRD